MARKKKTAISQINESVSKLTKRLGRDYTKKASNYKSETRQQEKRAAELARKNARKFGWNREVQEERALKAKLRIREKRARGLEKINSEKEIKIHRVKSAAKSYKEEVKSAARILSGQKQGKFSELIRQAPQKLINALPDKFKPKGFGEPPRSDLPKALPTKKDFQEVFDQGRIGRGLDYPVPFSYQSYLDCLEAARATGMAWGYMLHVDFELNGEFYRTTLLPMAVHISTTLSWDEILEAIGIEANQLKGNKIIEDIPEKGAVGRVKNSYPLKAQKGSMKKAGFKIIGLHLHFTILGKKAIK